MGLQVIALVCLIGAIVLGFVKKTNVGLVCFGLALILGKIGGMGASDIFSRVPFGCKRLKNSIVPSRVANSLNGNPL